MLYTAAFDAAAANAISALGSISMTLTGAGLPTITVNMGNLTDTRLVGTGNATTFWVWSEAVPGTPASSYAYCIDESPYALARFTHFATHTFGGALTKALQTEATAQGWGTKKPRVTFDTTTGHYAVSAYDGVTEQATSLVFSNDTAKALLGFLSTSITTATGHTSDAVPLYVISPTLGDVSDPTLNYEPAAIGNRVSVDSGAGFGLARYVSPLYRDWRQEFEVKARTMRLSKVFAHPWTFQHLFEHCRGRFPFLVSDGGFELTETYPEVFTLRESGIPFKPMRSTPGDDSHMHISFETVVEGHLMPGSSE